jgi:hypothetical protein
LVLTDVLGDIIVDQLDLIAAPARAGAAERAHELVSALADWAETQGESEIQLALQQLTMRIVGALVMDDRSRPQPGLH